MSIEKVKILGAQLKLLTLTLILLTPLVIIVLIAFYGPFALSHIPGEIKIYSEMINWFQGTIVVLVSLFTIAIYMVGYIYMYQLFDLYSKGIIFDKANIILVRKAGLALVAIDIVSIFQSLITGPVLSLLGVTERYISLEIKVSMLVVGIFVVLVSRIMEMAKEIFERDQLTI